MCERVLVVSMCALQKYTLPSSAMCADVRVCLCALCFRIVPGPVVQSNMRALLLSVCMFMIMSIVRLVRVPRASTMPVRSALKVQRLSRSVRCAFGCLYVHTAACVYAS